MKHSTIPLALAIFILTLSGCATDVELATAPIWLVRHGGDPVHSGIRTLCTVTNVESSAPVPVTIKLIYHDDDTGPCPMGPMDPEPCGAACERSVTIDSGQAASLQRSALSLDSCLVRCVFEYERSSDKPIVEAAAIVEYTETDHVLAGDGKHYPVMASKAVVLPAFPSRTR